jgi:tetratricopeptide (TPR) repeat protein
MTHAESQDLLLDLAYGELDPERAAEVASHVEGCADCRKEKAALEETRRMAAPLRDLEEPSPGFDDRIQAAARAQAQLEHDGNLGQVIEVAGSVRPLGVEAARIDAHGPVKARAADRQRPRWLVRAALGGSVAVAAALALAVSSTLETRRNAEKVLARSEEYAIRVQPTAPQSVDSALRDAEAKRDKERADSPKFESGQAPEAPPPALKKEKVALRAPERKAPRSAGARSEGSGGDAALAAKSPAPEIPKEMDALQRKQPAAAAPPAGARSQGQAGDAVADGKRQVSTAAQAHAKQVAPSAGMLSSSPAASAESRPAKEAEAPVLAAGGIESNAQQARHAGNYLLAAALYRNAAEMRQRENDAGTAAWDLAHAVECLSAVGQFDEARRVRDELLRLYPSELTALSAARRALREVDPSAAQPR